MEKNTDYFLRKFSVSSENKRRLEEFDDIITNTILENVDKITELKYTLSKPSNTIDIKVPQKILLKCIQVIVRANDDGDDGDDGEYEVITIGTKRIIPKITIKNKEKINVGYTILLNPYFVDLSFYHSIKGEINIDNMFDSTMRASELNKIYSGCLTMVYRKKYGEKINNVSSIDMTYLNKFTIVFDETLNDSTEIIVRLISY